MRFLDGRGVECGACSLCRNWSVVQAFVGLPENVEAYEKLRFAGRKKFSKKQKRGSSHTHDSLL
jgi:hypothetical protein